MVAFLSIGVVHLSTRSDILQRYYREGLRHVLKLPLGFPGPVMIQHIGEGNHGSSAQTIDLHPKVTGRHAHTSPFELIQRTHLWKGSIQQTYFVIIFGDSVVSFIYLFVQKRTR
jgi:hypothetical protein